MKRTLSLILILTMLLSLAACGSKDAAPTDDDNAPSQEQGSGDAQPGGTTGTPDEPEQPEQTQPTEQEPADSKPEQTQPADNSKPKQEPVGEPEKEPAKQPEQKPEPKPAEKPAEGTSAEPPTETPKPETPAEDKPAAAVDDALTILNAIWNTYSDEEKFPAAGGDSEHAVDGAPGSFDVSNADSLSYQLTFPADDASLIDSAASLVHMMNLNTFTCGAFMSPTRTTSPGSRTTCARPFRPSTGCAASRISWSSSQSGRVYFPCTETRSWSTPSAISSWRAILPLPPSMTRPSTHKTAEKKRGMPRILLFFFRLRAGRFSYKIWSEHIAARRKRHAEAKVEAEHHLHIRAAAGEPAADLPLRADHRGRPDGLRKDHRGELVSGGARKGRAAARRPHQRVFRQSCDLLAERAGRLCRAASTCCGSMPVPRTPPAAGCWRTISARSCRGKRPAICSPTIFTCLQTRVTAFLCSLAAAARHVT